MRSIAIFYSLAMAVFVGVLSQGCAKPIGNDPNSADFNPPAGVVDDSAGFYVRYVTTENYSYDLHRDINGFGTPCVAAAGESVDCYMEAEELDLWYWGATLQYNVPRELCTYFRYMPYDFAQFEYGRAPTSIQQDTDATGRVCHDLNNNGSCADVGDVFEACPWDYTEFDGPDCCEGNYAFTSRAWSPTAPIGYGPASTNIRSWSGLKSNCLDGPAVDSQPKTSRGWPMATLSFVQGAGVNDVYPIAAPATKGRNSNIYIASYFNPVEHPLFGFPIASSPVANPPNVGANERQPYYEWLCLDAAYDTIAAIRLHVREWNTEAAYLARSAAPTAHDLTGAEDPPFSIYNKNDRNDWRDFGDNPATAYPGFRD